ncbi:MAG: hypothetical protein ABIQ32_02200 [Sphingomicrobium sp.]
MVGRRIPLVAACAGSLLLVPQPAVAASRTYTIVIDKMKFGPVPANFRKDDSIVWVNRDMFRHTATARDHSFDIDLPAGARRRTLVRKTGSIAFLCRYHPGMRGVLKVR